MTSWHQTEREKDIAGELLSPLLATKEALSASMPPNANLNADVDTRANANAPARVGGIGGLGVSLGVQVCRAAGL